MNENELYVLKEYNFDNPLFHKIDSILDDCYRDCHNKYFQTFKYVCIYDNKLTNIANNEIINISFSDESMKLFGLNKKLTLASFRFSHINKLTKKHYSHLRYISIRYYLKFTISMCLRRFFRVISQNRDYVNNFCNDRNNTFHFACQKKIKNCT